MWEVELSLIEDWLLSLDKDSYEMVVASIEILAECGPMLGRPLVDTLKGSKIKNLKELRPGSAGRSEIRILFVFDPSRKAVFLVAGDKSKDWGGWYKKAIPLAESLYGKYLNN